MNAESECMKSRCIRCAWYIVRLTPSYRTIHDMYLYLSCYVREIKWVLPDYGFGESAKNYRKYYSPFPAVSLLKYPILPYIVPYLSSRVNPRKSLNLFRERGRRALR